MKPIRFLNEDGITFIDPFANMRPEELIPPSALRPGRQDEYMLPDIETMSKEEREARRQRFLDLLDKKVWPEAIHAHDIEGYWEIEAPCQTCIDRTYEGN